MSRSHTFVIHGDISKIHADGYVIPADSRLIFEERWQGILGGQPQPRYHLPRAGDPRRITWGVVTEPAPGRSADDPHPDHRLMLVTDIASGSESLAQMTSGLELALDEAAAHWHEGHDSRRSRPLLAMPLIGSGRGGFRGVQGRVVKALLETLDERVPGLPFDVVLVCFTRAQYSAVQSTRASARLCLPALPPTLDRAAVTLADFAATESLGVLFGAGVSIPLGLPDWSALLRALASGTTFEDLGDLSGLDPMDAASLLLSAMPEPGDGGDAFKDRLSRSVGLTRHSLAHGLLASLRPTVAVTTNYDRGYELALTHVIGDGGPAIMPWHPPLGAAAPRVLKLHGDVEEGSIVLRREDFLVMHATRRPLTALLQEQMLAHHVLAIGTSMSDSTLVSAIAEASTLLREIETDRSLGTLVMTRRNPARAALLGESMTVLSADEPATPGGPRLEPAAAARVTDMLLDAVAVRSMREISFLADPQFADLVKDDASLVAVAESARALREAIDATGGKGNPQWVQVLAALDGLGATGTKTTRTAPFTLADARALARRFHEGQVDKLGVPYIEHVEAVADGLVAFHVDVQIAGMLHDIVEDCDITVEDLRSRGVSERSLAALELVSRNLHPELSYAEAIQRVTGSPDATLVKIADNAHNSRPDRVEALQRLTGKPANPRYAAARRVLYAAANPRDVAQILRRVAPSLLAELPPAAGGAPGRDEWGPVAGGAY